MKHPVRSIEDLGLAIRAVRKSTGIRQDDLAGTVGVSRQFAVDVEKGKATVQFDRVMLLLAELGMALSVEIPEAASRTLSQLQARKLDKAAARVAAEGRVEGSSKPST